MAELLSNAAQTNANFDFDSRINKPARDAQVSDFAAQDQAAKNALRDAFKGGVPTTPDGQPDFGAMAKVLFQKGGLSEGTAASNLDIQRQQLKMGQDTSARMGQMEGGAQPAQPANLGPPSASRPASTVAVQPSNRGAPQGSPQGDQPGSIVGLVSAAGIPDELAGPVIQQVSALTKSDPNATLNPDIAARVQQVVQAAAQRMKGGQAPQPTGLTPQQAPQGQPQAVPQAAPQAPPQAVNPQQNQGTFGAPPATPTRGAVPTGNDPEIQKQIATYTAIASNPAYPKSVQEAALSRLKALQEQGAPTGPMKEYDLYRRQGGNMPFKDFLADLESGKAGATERAKADVKEQQDYIDQGRNAQARLGTLNTITNIVNSDKNLQLGFGSETTLKIKMALQQAGIDFGDLSGAQLIQKLNGVLASESSKSFSTRPTQFEFKTFLANNPGLALDEKGNVRMLGILAQTAKREADLGKLARQNRDNWDNWDTVVEGYDKDHPVKDPTTGKILSNHSIIAPGGKSQGAAPGGAFNSPADVHAAVASGKLKKGDTFVDGNGKTRVVP